MTQLRVNNTMIFHAHKNLTNKQNLIEVANVQQNEFCNLLTRHHVVKYLNVFTVDEYLQV